MTTYGVTPEGFNRKPLATILAEIETRNITQYGPDLIQTSQSPMGVLNGLVADLISEVWELAEDVYQSYDPDQAEGTRLEMLGRIRLLLRNARVDPEFRQAITNEGSARVGLEDIETALLGLPGVTYAKVFTDRPEFAVGLAVAVLGGTDVAIVSTLQKYLVPGIVTYGNTRVEAELDGKCRSVEIIRPSDIPVTVALTLRIRAGNGSCPAPSVVAIIEALVAGWEAVRNAGDSVTHYRIRGIIEKLFPQVELVDFTGGRDSVSYGLNQPVSISLFEIASLAEEDVSVTVL